MSEVTDVDPFDLPDWLGVGEVVWEADAGVRATARVPGRLCGSGHQLPCDLLAGDEAYPTPVADEATRSRAHQAWRHGQVLLVSTEGRLTLVVPGSRFTADGVLDALGRLARAVAASPGRYSARLRLGVAPTGRGDSVEEAG